MWNLSLPEGLHSPDLNVKNMSKQPCLSIFPIVFLLDTWILFFAHSLDTFTAFSSRDDILNKSRDKSDLAGIYSSYISHQLSKFPESKGLIGALIIEPGKNVYISNFIHIYGWIV